MGAQQPAPLRIRPQEAGRPRRAVPRADQLPSQLCECRLADRGRLVSELHFAGPSGFAIRSAELPEPHEPCHAGVGRLFEQMLEVAPKPGRDPLGDARFDPALRIHQCVGTEPLDRRRGRQDRSRVTAGLDEPAHQVLVRLCLFRFFSEPPPEKDRNPSRRRSSARCSCRISDRTA